MQPELDGAFLATGDRDYLRIALHRLRVRLCGESLRVYLDSIKVQHACIESLSDTKIIRRAKRNLLRAVHILYGFSHGKRVHRRERKKMWRLFLTSCELARRCATALTHELRRGVLLRDIPCMHGLLLARELGTKK